jgi:nucleoside-diphosphate-sugar epimerase
MKIFLAGATGAIGRRLTPLLVAAGHHVTGMTRNPASADALEKAGISTALVDVFDADALKTAMVDAAPEVVMHQLTDLPRVLENENQLAAAYPRNARIRLHGTRNLIAAAQAAAARRFIVQSVAFGYAPGREPHSEDDPLDVKDGPRAVTIGAAADMERQVLTSGMPGIVLRYGFFYGPGTWQEGPTRRPAVHIDVAAHAAVLAVTRGHTGTYNIVEEDGTVSIAKARSELGFDPTFRVFP